MSGLKAWVGGGWGSGTSGPRSCSPRATAKSPYLQQGLPRIGGVGSLSPWSFRPVTCVC